MPSANPSAVKKTLHCCAEKVAMRTISTSPSRRRVCRTQPVRARLAGSINAEAAKKMLGVLAVYTAADLAAYGPHKCALDFKQRDGSPMKKPVRKSLASDKVRFVGDPIACVIAETAVQAKDAAEAVELDIEPLPAVATASQAAAPGAPQLYDDVPNNVCLDFLWGKP